MNHKRKRSHKFATFIWLCIFAFTAVLAMLLFVLIGGIDNIFDIVTNMYYWCFVALCFGIILIAYLMMTRIDAQNIALDQNELEDTDWLTTKQLRKMQEFSVMNYSEVQSHKDGIVIGAKVKRGNNVEIITTSNLHALIVGTTGSGKTTGFVDQNIAVLGKCKTKPSLIIADPKKELYEKHAEKLKSEGYKISVLNLREPYASSRWNPMNVLIRRIRMIKDMQNHFYNEGGKYYGGGEKFESYEALHQRVEELKGDIFENAMDLVYTICPIKNKEQPNWEEGARNLILGLVLAFCEDCINGKMDEEQLVLFNVYHNITKYLSEDTSVLKEYLLEGREEFSKVRGLVNTVLITSDKTLTSYLSEVNSYMQQLSDDGILALMSENDLEITTLDEEPNAIFIVVPDERKTRHGFATLFVTQVYKELVEKANLNYRRKELNEVTLKRHTYFILDEFGNLPKFEDMESMLTVSRSRGIRFLLVLQSFSQIAAKYGKDGNDTIKSNCNVKIFIGSDDPDTRKEFSELCGQKKVKSFSVNTNLNNDPSSNTGASNQPLITPGMLERLNGNDKGDAIVSVRGYEPIWTVFTPSYKLKKLYFGTKEAESADQPARTFDKTKYVYDILNPDGGNETDILFDELDKELNKQYEEEDAKEAERKADLDKQWTAVVDDIRLQIEQLANVLSKEDKDTVLAARLEDKPTLLYMLAEEGGYNQSAVRRIKMTADILKKKSLPELQRLQDEAISPAA